MKRYIPVNKDELQPDISNRFFRDALTELRQYYFDKEKYYHIEKNLLFPDSELAFSLFVHKNFNYDLLLKASEANPAKLSPESLSIEGDIVIKISDIPLYNEYIKSLDNHPGSAEQSEKVKASLIKENSKLVMKDVLSNPRSGKNIKESGKIVERIAESILSNKGILYDLISVKNYDYYTYVHSVNVAVLSIGLGIAANLIENKIFKLGFGSILHDIGKSAISPEILNKPGRLTFLEFRILQNHVMEGENILSEQPDFPDDSLSSVTQHHEKLSGKGYPFNLTGAKITVFGKITSITDCYDALTTQRPYKPALSPFDALSIIVNDCEHYDSELLKTFIKMLGGIED